MLGCPVYQNVTQFSLVFNRFVRDTRRRWKHRRTTSTPLPLQTDIDGIQELSSLLQDHLRTYGHVEGSVTDAFTTSLAKIQSLLSRISQPPEPHQDSHAPRDSRMDPRLSRQNLETYGTSAWADEVLSSTPAHEFTNREFSLQNANEPLVTPYGEMEIFVPSSSQKAWNLN